MKKLENLTFKKFCMTIGNLPSSYVESLSYYECLMWLCNYLQTEVIPTVNNNSEAVEELQGLFVQLQQYVNNYFDNLDVQEEINNKLDDMVEQGTLQEIIADYLNSKAVFGFDTVADMIASTNLINGSYAKTLGYHSLNDKGSALYKIRNITNDDVVDNMTIIAMVDDDLIAELISPYTPERLGAYGDGIHDDSSYIERYFELINSNEHVHLSGNYALSESIKLPTGYGISIDGGTFTALSDFDNTKSDALLYVSAENVTQPDNFSVASTGLRLSNITFMCDFKTDGIEVKKSLNLNIDKCLFTLYKTYGINVSSTDTHDLLITNSQFKGNTYQGSTSSLANTGIRLQNSDSTIRGCNFAYGYAGMEVNRSANLIDGCHFYAHQNNGYNLKLGSTDNIVTGCYFDGGGLYLSSGWRNYVTDSLFLLGDTTNYIVKVGTDSPSTHNVDFIINNCSVHDLRSNTSSAINFITEYADNITNFTTTKVTNIKIIAGNVNINSPLDGVQINETNPTILGLHKYESTVTGTSYGELTPIDGETQNYQARVSGNTIEVNFLNTASYYKYLIVPFVVTEKSRILLDVEATSTTTPLIWKTDGTYISNNKKATLDPGTYYLGLYKNVTRCVIKVNA